MAEKGTMGSGDTHKLPYTPPNPPKTGPGSGGRKLANPPNPPKTPIQGAQGGGKNFRGIIGGANIPSYKKGGRVRKTGVALVHKGEEVVPTKGTSRKHGKKKTAKR